MYKVVNNEKTQYKIMKNEMEKHNNSITYNNNTQENNIFSHKYCKHVFHYGYYTTPLYNVHIITRHITILSYCTVGVCNTP